MIVNSSSIPWLFFGNFTILFSTERVRISTDLAKRKYSHQNPTICTKVRELFYFSSSWHFKLIFGYFKCLSKTTISFDFTSVDRPRSLVFFLSRSASYLMSWTNGTKVRIQTQTLKRHVTSLSFSTLPAPS